MKIRVLRAYHVPVKYCNENDSGCQSYKSCGNKMFPDDRCELFKCKLERDGKNILKCQDCKKAEAGIVETGCEFCNEPGYLRGYKREYVGPHYSPADPPFCPECGRRRRK